LPWKNSSTASGAGSRCGAQTQAWSRIPSLVVKKQSSMDGASGSAARIASISPKASG
jgi:hypothetical protein